MLNVDDAWTSFKNKSYISTDLIHNKKSNKKVPKCNELYISTQTKIVFLNQNIDIYNIFWSIPIIPYETQQEGILKKQIKINCISNKEVNSLENKIEMTKKQSYVSVNILKQLNYCSRDTKNI